MMSLNGSPRIGRLKNAMLNEPRFASIEQARLVTQSYKQTEGDPTILRRAKAFALAAEQLEIRIDPDELIVGNRTAGVRGGVVFPEFGLTWVNDEFETLPTRPQDKFNVREEDIREFREQILPYWEGHTLEDVVNEQLGPEAKAAARVIKINQKDHAQGHICPDTETWLREGSSGARRRAEEALAACTDESKKPFYESVIITLTSASEFMRRYAALAEEMELPEIARICAKLADSPPDTFHEALQSLWFLYVLLQLESNASSFSPGRADQYLYPFFKKDVGEGRLTHESAQELIDALWLKFNQIVYLRNKSGAKYFAGFPIGFNIAIGGQTPDGQPAENELSFMFLTAQDHIALPQPNLSARLYEGSSQKFIEECSRVIGLGSGMPQIFNDEAVIPALEAQGISHEDAQNYAIVGCVELTTHGNNLGWSDAAMFNLVKALELTLNNGVCLLTGEQTGLPLGTLADYPDFQTLEKAFTKQLDHFIDQMMGYCAIVDRLHAEIVPSPFLSSVIHDCIGKGVDVTAGGAYYNLSGIQAIQPANLADSFAVLKTLVFDEKKLSAEELLTALRGDFEGLEVLRQECINKVPKFGNDVPWVDELGAKWIRHFANRLKEFTNVRGGPYHTGLYTVSAHVPMGQNVGASPDGRHARDPLADGGMSAMYGRDINGPTALLKSVSRISSMLGSNGTLLNMKFLPEFFKSRADLQKFSAMLRAFVRLKISHVQFNVLRREDLLAAQENPELYRSLTVRVAGYTAYFTELAGDLQDEIIARTTYGGEA
ncbi:formate C-acetyltransferase/glycerol dehydratase family glycyl radical enzyme [Pontiella sulfatireligans]